MVVASIHQRFGSSDYAADGDGHFPEVVTQLDKKSGFVGGGGLGGFEVSVRNSWPQGRQQYSCVRGLYNSAVALHGLLVVRKLRRFCIQNSPSDLTSSTRPLFKMHGLVLQQ